MAEQTRASVRRRMLKALPKATGIVHSVTSALRIANTKGMPKADGGREADHPELNADDWREIAKRLKVAAGMYESASDAADHAAELIDRGDLK